MVWALVISILVLIFAISLHFFLEGTNMLEEHNIFVIMIVAFFILFFIAVILVKWLSPQMQAPANIDTLLSQIISDEPSNEIPQ